MQTPFIRLFAIGFALAALVAIGMDQFKTEPSAQAFTCDVTSGVCDAVAGIELQFSGAIEVNKPLTLTMRLPSGSEQIERLEANLTGVDMYMGITQANLAKQTNGTFVGEIRIPICTTEKMDWKLAISAPDSKAAPIEYLFSTQH